MGPWYWLKELSLSVLFMADKRLSIISTRTRARLAIKILRNQTWYSPHACDQLPCCREHFLSVIWVSGLRPTTTVSKCGSWIRWCRQSCLTNQHTRIMALGDATEEIGGNNKHASSGATPQHHHTCHLPAVHLEASDLTSLVSISSPVKWDNDRTRVSCKDEIR